MQNSNRKKIFYIVIITIISLITIFSCLKLIPFLFSLKDETNRIVFEKQVDDLGFLGILLILIIQILQVFIAFIPGEIIELLAGLLYGAWFGLILCLIGNFIGSFLIYITVKTFAKKSTTRLSDKLKQYSFLNNKKKISIYLFLIYLIPGIPKDIITYLIPFLPINFLPFILVTSIARIPSIISSTYSSHSFLNNDYTIALLLIIIFAFLALIGFIFKDKIMMKLKENNSKEINNNSSK